MLNKWEKVKIIGIILLILVILVFSYVWIYNRTVKSLPDTERIIDSLSNKIDSIKVENITLIQKNDSIRIKIVEVERNHEENTSTILTNTVSDDYLFFTDYIARYNDSNYTRTVKDS